MKFKKFKLKSGGKLITIMALITALTTICSMPALAMRQKPRKKLKEKISLIIKYSTENFKSKWPKIILDKAREPKNNETEPKNAEDLECSWGLVTYNPYRNDKITDLVHLCGLLQEKFILSENSITNNPIDWSGFNQTPVAQINPRNLFDISHGIVNYITFNSQNKFNTAELNFFCTGYDKYRTWKNGKGKQFQNSSGYFKYDVLNILPIYGGDVEQYLAVDHDRYEWTNVAGYWFKRVTVNPVGYALRVRKKQGDTVPCSVRFWGIDENSNKYPLDERLNINDLMNDGSYAFYCCRTTDKQFKAFAVEMFSSSNGSFNVPYNIVFFEVHGNVFLEKNDDKENQKDSIDFFSLDQGDFEDSCFFNPFVDIPLI